MEALLGVTPAPGGRHEHRDPAPARAVLDALGLAVRIDRAEAFALVATIGTQRGTVELR